MAQVNSTFYSNHTSHLFSLSLIIMYFMVSLKNVKGFKQ